MHRDAYRTKPTGKRCATSHGSRDCRLRILLRPVSTLLVLIAMLAPGLVAHAQNVASVTPRSTEGAVPAGSGTNHPAPIPEGRRYQGPIGTPSPTATSAPSPTATSAPSPTATSAPRPTATSAPSNPITLGVYPNNPNDMSKIGEIDTYNTLIGGTARIVHYAISWSDGDHFQSNIANAIVARGATPMLTWNPYDWRYGINQPQYSDASIAAGQYDPLLQTWGRELAAWGQPIYLRIGDEMNGNWDSWSPGVNGNTIATYLDMWRHVVTTMRNAGGGLPNVHFVWSPSTIDQGVAADFTPMYPGDAYVDWVGLDGFNWGTTNDGWKTMSQIASRSYAEMVNLTNKPLMIAETGCAEQGGDKAAWLTQTFLTDIPTLFPKIRAIIYQNEDETLHGERANWLVNTSPTALAAWRQIVQDPRYQGQ
jgi:beta-mannanase